MEAEKIKHLEFVQNIVTRMNANSFQIKTWTVTLTTGLLAIYSSTKNAQFVLLALLPVLLFWFLDAYYLQQERKFRGLYKDLTSDNPQNNINVFNMPINLYIGGSYSYSSTFFSKTIYWFYLSIFVLLVIVFFLVSNM